MTTNAEGAPMREGPFENNNAQVGGRAGGADAAMRRVLVASAASCSPPDGQRQRWQSVVPCVCGSVHVRYSDEPPAGLVRRAACGARYLLVIQAVAS